VEGRRDAEALERLGVKGEFLCVKAGGSLPETLSRLELEAEGREIIVLTDFDRGGVELAMQVSRKLEEKGFHPNLEFWLRLKALMSRQVKDMEGLASYLENVKRKLSL